MRRAWLDLVLLTCLAAVLAAWARPDPPAEAPRAGWRPEDLVVGGVRLGMSRDEVVRLKGEPFGPREIYTKKPYMEYGDLEVFVPDGHVACLRSQSGFRFPGGVFRVGIPRVRVLQVLGPPAHRDLFDDSEVWVYPSLRICIHNGRVAGPFWLGSFDWWRGDI